MRNSLEQYRAVVGTHFMFIMSRDYEKCFKGQFWCTVILLFYMEALYLPVLKAVVRNYEG